MPAAIKSYLALIQKKLIESNFFEGRLVHPDQLHITMHFIGEINQEKVVAIQKTLRLIDAESFTVCLNKIGFFVDEEDIRVIWIGVDNQDSMNQLATQVRMSLRDIIAIDDAEKFSSHITLARVKKVIDRKRFLAFINSFVVEKHCFLVDEFVLKQSIISSQGPEYRDVERYALKKI